MAKEWLTVQVKVNAVCRKCEWQGRLAGLNESYVGRSEDVRVIFVLERI